MNVPFTLRVKPFFRLEEHTRAITRLYRLLLREAKGLNSVVPSIEPDIPQRMIERVRRRFQRKKRLTTPEDVREAICEGRDVGHESNTLIC